MTKQLYGTTKTLVNALHKAQQVDLTPEDKTAFEWLEDALRTGKMILDPWEIDDVYNMTLIDDDDENKEGKSPLTEAQAIEVLTAFEANDYRTETGNEALTDLAYDMGFIK